MGLKFVLLVFSVQVCEWMFQLAADLHKEEENSCKGENLL